MIQFSIRPFQVQLCLCFCLWLGMAQSGQATHIVGGQLTLQPVGNHQGVATLRDFKVILTYYFNEEQTIQPNPDGLVVAFRKRDGQRMDSLRIRLVSGSRPPIAFTNPACAQIRGLRISVVRYEGDLRLQSSAYNDPQGYYLTHQTCCRNGGISNLQEPGRAGFLFYLEFPPLLKDGRPFINSPPEFSPLGGEYICRGRSFTFPSAARDADGDALRYSLVTPLYGFQDRFSKPIIRPAPYPEVQWLSGFGADRAIPGDPALTIDRTTGQLSVTASRLGLFVFSVRIEEFRDGEKIGEVRRDYQFLVVDCPTVSPPTPSITWPGQVPGATEADVCEGGTVRFEATSDPGWNYQWQRDGQNLPGPKATLPTLTAAEAGEYTLVTSLKNQCGESRRSEPVRLRTNAGKGKLTVNGPVALCEPNGAVTLQAPTGTAYTWLLNGQPIENQTSATLMATLPGAYAALVRGGPQGCLLRTDTLTLRTEAPPTVRLPAELVTWRGGDINLRPTMSQGIVRFQWSPPDFLTDSTQANTRATGIDRDLTYTLRVMNNRGCVASTRVNVRVYQRLWIPTVFTPNQDGINDVWELKGIEEYPNAVITLYNRWGDVVFRTSAGYARPFDGQIDGVPLPAGNYAYVVHPSPDQPALRGVLLLAR